MDAYIRNLHRDGVPKEEEEEPKEIKDSEGKYNKRFDLLWFDWSSVVIHAFPEAKWEANIPGGMHFHAYSGPDSGF